MVKQSITNNLYIDGSVETSHQTILSRVQKWFPEDSGWIIEKY